MLLDFHYKKIPCFGSSYYPGIYMNIVLKVGVVTYDL